MGARQKLNAAAVNGCILLAGVIGAACGSWFSFGVALALAIGIALIAGDIRPNRRGH